ncbi:hypothetical protein Pfo_019361 [Paulownia fortunei]|nr:hypothetical protein Pfo_019361 [Paulownia fortunei]
MPGDRHCYRFDMIELKLQIEMRLVDKKPNSSRPPIDVTSVEKGEEIEQLAESPDVCRRSPLRAPLGVSLNTKGTRKVLSHGSSPFVDIDTCYNNGELPDTSSLSKRLEQKLGMEGLNVSRDCVNLLNNGLDVFMKRLLKPCATSVLNGMRPLTYVQNSNRLFSVSITDFRVAMESNPRILGEDWPVQMEVSLCTSEEYMDG